MRIQPYFYQSISLEIGRIIKSTNFVDGELLQPLNVTRNTHTILPQFVSLRWKNSEEEGEEEEEEKIRIWYTINYKERLPAI